MLANAAKSFLRMAKDAEGSLQSCSVSRVTPSSVQIFKGFTSDQGHSQPSRSAEPSGSTGLPPIARALGYAGAIPFIALSPAVASMLPLLPPVLASNAALLQVGYGASIASFLGGIHWAMAMADYGGAAASSRVARERYLWSVSPCLLAWPALILPPGPGSLMVASTLGMAFAADRSFAARGLLPPWYMSLRLPLTAAATSGLLLTCVTSLFPSSKPQEPQGIK
eukprot:jgi/Botrbrau1/2884/Bobra.0036s0026.1